MAIKQKNEIRGAAPGLHPTHETSVGRRVAGGSLAALALIAVGYRINATLDNDRMFQTGRPVPAVAPPNPEHSSNVPDKDTMAIHVRSGDTAWDLAGNLTDGDRRPVVDEIMEASNKDGHPGLQAGETITIDKQ